MLVDGQTYRCQDGKSVPVKYIRVNGRPILIADLLAAITSSFTKSDRRFLTAMGITL
jgi:hypothetical protein